jgi:hypothetical protein
MRFWGGKSSLFFDKMNSSEPAKEKLFFNAMNLHTDSHILYFKSANAKPKSKSALFIYLLKRKFISKH